MAHDPFDTPGDRIRGVLKHWKVMVFVAVALAVLVERGMATRTGKDHLVGGEVIRIEPITGERASVRATVRLGEAQQATVALPRGTPCHAGSKIRLIRHDTVAVHDFRPADPPCTV